MNKRQNIVLVLDNIRSRENVGSIFRTADGVGVSKIYLCGITPRPPHPKIGKASLGAENYVPWEYIRQTGKIVTELKNRGLEVVALEQTKESKDIFGYKYPENETVLILGNEVKGVSKAILKKCDKVIHIPMYGRKESLNVSVAAGVALYLMRTERTPAHGK